MGHATTLNKRPPAATTIVAVPCNFEIVTEELAVAPETKETVRHFSALLENAGVEILETLLVPGANHIDFRINAHDRDVAQRALEASGIACRGLQ
jgi:hypothetical protein